MAKLPLVVLGVAVCLAVLAGTSSAKDHKFRWIDGLKYNDIAATVGDTLTFDYSYSHNIVQLKTPAAWPDSCKGQGDQVATVGPAVIKLSTAGTFTYICSVSDHCAVGQQSVTVVVAPAATTTTSTVVTVPWTYGMTKRAVTVNVGDSVKFDFNGGHDVVQLAAPSTSWPADCSAPTLASFTPVTAGPFTLKMNKAGKFSYICSYNDHCPDGGMYLDVTVQAKKNPSPPPKKKSPPPKKKRTGRKSSKCLH